ncbi:Putative glycine cleavage system H protein, mitochondrial [Vanrija pseudolonga]|uniref:Glycine cleavage system H protein n=1 Tax=Vanrija pseudolonga TaxID=143232 RepID=A0AAF0YF79_9TREE|nr:Putative glycine cleavage system H protein, mitochondrial [Vanrija pseudolonga]
MSLRALARPVAAALRAPRFTAAPRVAGVRFGSTTRFSKDHEWVTYDDATKIGVVGITDYAQKALGDVVFVELPQEGTEVEEGESIGAVESVKAASDIYAPVSGVVEAINEALGDQPSLLNKSPEQDGWLAKIKVSDEGQFLALLDAEAYKAHCEGA